MSKLSQKKLIYGILFLVFYIVLSPIKPTYGDDQIYQGILNGKQYFDWVVQLYQVWTGRVVLTSSLVYLLNAPLVIWRSLNAAMFTLLVYSLTELVQWKELTALWMSILVLTLPISILSSSAFWITGSLNYLWPTSIMIYLLHLLWRFFKHEKISNGHFAIAYFISIFASNMEQSAMVIVVFYGIILTYVYFAQKRLDKRIIGLWLFMIVGFLFMMLAPGNLNRFNAEVFGLNPNFEMLDVYDKLMIGLSYTFNVLFNEMKLYLWIINLSILVLSLKGRKNILFSSIPFLMISFKGTFDLVIRLNPYCRMCNDVHYILFNHQYFEPFYFVEWIHMIPIIIGFTYIIFTVVSMFAIEGSFKIAIFNSLILASGISSAVILGFSPTINASGHRIFFVLAVQVVLIMMIYLSRIFSHIKSRWVEAILICIGLVWFIRIAYTFATISEFIVVY